MTNKVLGILKKSPTITIFKGWHQKNLGNATQQAILKEYPGITKDPNARLTSDTRQRSLQHYQQRSKDFKEQLSSHEHLLSKDAKRAQEIQSRKQEIQKTMADLHSSESSSEEQKHSQLSQLTKLNQELPPLERELESLTMAMKSHQNLIQTLNNSQKEAEQQVLSLKNYQELDTGLHQFGWSLKNIVEQLRDSIEPPKINQFWNLATFKLF